MGKTSAFGLGVAVIAVLVVLSVVLGTWYTVDEGERGVKLRNGAFTSVAEPGLGFKLPFIDSVKYISVQTHTRHYENITAYSKDQQPASLIASVTYRVPVDMVEEVYRQYGSVDNLVVRTLDRIVPNQLENTFGKYNAINVVQHRDKFTADIKKAIFENVPDTLIVEQVQVENIDFSDQYEKSVEDRMKAEVAVATRNQELEREKISAQIVETTAQGEAAANVAKAEAEAQAIRMRGDAEAAAIRARADALRENQNLVELIKAERWNGVLPTTVLPNGAVPFIDAR